jgi:signal transduction histidine kinase
MISLSISARVALIVVASVIALWIFAIGHYYRTQAVPGEAGRPAPTQIAAIVELLENVPADQQPTALEAISSVSLVATLTPEWSSDPPPADAVAVPADVEAAYVAAIGRDVTVLTMPGSFAERRFPMLFAKATNALEFRVALKSGKLLIVKTRSPVTLSRFGLPIGFGAGLAGTLIALVALIAMHRIMRPMAKLAAAVDRINPVGETVALPRIRTSAPEIRALFGAFDRLQTRVSQLLQARLALLGGISHDVRTFATRLRLRLDQIPDAQERERAATDINDMINLLDDALLASRAGTRELNEELIDFGQLVRGEADDRVRAGQKVELVPFDHREVAVLGDRIALRRIVANLIDNALKFGHVARLRLRAVDGQAVLTVEDDGPGIPPELREAMLEPFARADASRSRETGGAGLGLAVVRNLVGAHGGAIAIGGSASGGARVTVTLPVFKAEIAS